MFAEPSAILPEIADVAAYTEIAFAELDTAFDESPKLGEVEELDTAFLEIADVAAYTEVAFAETAFATTVFAETAFAATAFAELDTAFDESLELGEVEEFAALNDSIYFPHHLNSSNPVLNCFPFLFSFCLVHKTQAMVTANESTSSPLF